MSDSEGRANAGAGVSLEFGDDGVALLEFDDPGAKHNRFTPELLERMVGLLEDVRRAGAAGEIDGLVVCSAKPDSFIAGMDVETIATVRTEAAGSAGARQGQRVFQALADLPVPSVAAINGTCLGGATEMALACTWRLAADSLVVEIGFPEVNLGIIPGFGGTQRLPRLISLERAMPMILTGRPIGAARAKRIGLVDEVVPAPLLLRVACSWARGDAGPGAGAAASRSRRSRPAPEDRPWPRRLRRALLEGNPLGRSLVFRQATKSVRTRTHGHYPAPFAAIDAVRRGLKLSLDQGLRLEADLVGGLIGSGVTDNLMGLFFLRQGARRAVNNATGGGPPAAASGPDQAVFKPH